MITKKLYFRSVWIFTAGLIVVKSFSCFTGLIMYAYYETCDPITTKAVEKNDQVPRIVFQINVLCANDLPHRFCLIM